MTTGNILTSCKVFDKNTYLKGGDCYQKHEVPDLATCEEFPVTLQRN